MTSRLSCKAIYANPPQSRLVVIQATPTPCSPLPRIAVCIAGPTGFGKSEFINIATGHDEPPVNHTLESSPIEIQTVSCANPDDKSQTITFVEVPALDNSHGSPEDVERKIRVWIDKTQKRKTRIVGVLYMHDVRRKRMVVDPQTMLVQYVHLFGQDVGRRVLFVLTKGKQCNLKQAGNPAQDERREEVIREKYWQRMVRLGSSVVRYERTQDSAWSMIRLLLRNADDDMSPPRVIVREPADVDIFKVKYQRRRHKLAATITALRHAKEIADISHVPFLGSTIQLVLSIAISVDALDHADHSLVTLAQNAGGLVAAVTELVQTGGIPDDMRQAVENLIEQLDDVQQLIANIRSEDMATRYIFQTSDDRVVAACNMSIIYACSLFESLGEFGNTEPSGNR
ncbi:hypothetical protein BD410DRAFT_831659 [Rickenella mellea]|uniref:G domain-containing protein n=1 Tax=Rickenella mellea TaxID=50990 RepID=A0A4Y7PQI9_9AGAM|nr:hypothetical protein BD410DRAFT_831659 [Rickenella mellea]